MSKKLVQEFPDLKDNEKVTKKVVTETVEKKGGVQTTTTTITCTKDDFEAAFKKLNVDPEKFKSGGTTVTRQIIYTNSAGAKEVLQETVESFDKPGISTKITKTETSPKKTCDNPASVRSPEKKGKPQKAGKFEEECLKKHNEYRGKHGVPKLELSDELCAYAREWANNLAATDSFKHRTERKYGENIFMKWSSDPNHVISGDAAVESWYSEIKDHTFGQEPRSLKSGHFTQVIWKESKRLGVACAKSKSGKILVVANYEPAGNFVGRFTENVPPPKK
ncbi:golgi-associated plant pathogenesis-related protein 1 [Trichonephila inaurata madagascariensis]|uniref:Golgi-associated plant pathogenesis-related protein 1 n=1 Tax=Trichonephila inaurata madagascariensis TaxID=2747483 RepID=A0A8X6YGC9_9ARAC|nr:golgi-associated plant pathogenesis-related protein 1 [Trichonephila inaurata madagascariensis]